MIHPNTLTMARVVLAPVVSWLLFDPVFETRVAAFFVFTIAALTDLWDGYIARKKKQESDFGKILDPIADKVLVLVTMFTFSALGIYSVWFLVPLLAREAVVTLVRLKSLREGFVFAARAEGKLKTNVQIVSVILSYAYLMVRDHGGSPDLVQLFCILNYFILGIAVFFTVYSGYRFFVDNKLGDALAEVLATGLYLGYLPNMPGTFGSLLGFFLACLMPEDLFAYSGILLLLTVIAIWSADAYCGKKGVKDPPEVVSDEVVGAIATYFAIPCSPLALFAGFFLFRAFDIFKPPPVRSCERARGGFGIVLDDLAAGVYANTALRILIFLVSFVS